MAERKKAEELKKQQQLEQERVNNLSYFRIK
jgi:hypothetical protein